MDEKRNENDVFCSRENENFLGRVGMSNTHPTAYFEKFYTYIVCIDYFKFKFTPYHGKDDIFVKKLLQKIFLSSDSVTEEPGKSLFQVYNTYDEDVYVYGGREKEKDEFGNYTYFFEMKGHALRLFELRCKKNGVDYLKAYQDLFHFVIEKINEGHVTIKKLDVAIDDFTGSITKEEYDERFTKGFYVTKFRSVKKIDEKVLQRLVKSAKGWSWLIGNYSSNHIMFYDKKLERENKDEETNRESWIRVEARFREERANHALLKLYNGLVENQFLETICGLIGGLIELKENNRYARSNMYKAPIWKKWDELLHHAKPIDISISQGEVEDDILYKNLTYLKMVKWFDEAVYRVFALIYLADPLDFELFESYILDKALDNLKEKDLAKVNYYRDFKKLKPLNLKEAQDLLYKRIRYLKNISSQIEEGKRIFGDDLSVN